MIKIFKEEDMDHEEKFSKLPIEVVILIVSLLSFEEALRLCLTRREWFQLRLWKYSTCMALHNIIFRDINTSQQEEQYKPS